MNIRNYIALGLSLFMGGSLFATTYLPQRTTIKPISYTPEDLEVVDEYSVIKVNGQIIFVRSGNDMATGDVFKSDEQLDFKTNESRAAVISEIKGRFVLTASSDDDGINLGPAMNNISSRSGALLNMIDLQNHFTDNYLILDRIELEIGDGKFPQDDNNFFFMQFDLNGEQINKMLAHDGNKLIIEKSELFKVDEAPVTVPENTPMKLWYMESAKQQTTLINEFTPVFPDLDDLKAEVGVLVSQLSDDKDRDTKISEITAYLTEFYGKPESDHLEAWLDDNFEL